jgi:hypothetical protein
MRVARSSQIILLVVITACSTQEEPTVPGTFPKMVNGSDGVVFSASGGGIVDLSALAGASDAHFAFTAIQRGDGTAHGRFHQHRERNGLIVDFSGDVTCLTVDPLRHRARIGGVVTENNSTDPAFRTENHEIGDDVWFRVADGGEGKDAVDASTTYGFKPTLVNTSAEYCALPFDGLPWWNPATTFPLESGNIQIRP